MDAELARLVLEVEAGRHRLDHDTTLAELLEQWVTASSIDWSPATTYQYRWTIEHRIVPHLGALPVHRLRAHDLNTLYATPSERIQANPCQLRQTSLGCEACHRTPPRATRR